MNRSLTRLVVACLGLAACATAGRAGALTLDVGAPRANGMMTTVAVTLTNSGRRPHQKASVTCAFFDAEGRQLTVGRAYLPSLAPGASETGGFMIHPDLGQVARHRCKVD